MKYDDNKIKEILLSAKKREFSSKDNINREKIENDEIVSKRII